MSMLAQVGYGKKNLIQDALGLQSITGAILSARSERLDSIGPFMSGVRQAYDHSVLLFDPQCYMQTMPDMDLGHIDEYPFFLPSLQTDSLLTPRQIMEWVRLTVDYQLELPVTYVLSPTEFVGSLASESLFTSLSLAAETLAHMEERGEDSSRVLVSLCLSHNVLTDRRNLNTLLNKLTGTPAGSAAGVYLVIDVDPDERELSIQEPYMDSHSLAALMRICYGLGHLNERVVHVAFAGYVGLLLQAVGAASTSAGWFTKERRFSQRDYRPRTISRQPNERYSSSKLMTSVLVSPNLTNYVQLLGPEEVITDARPGTPQPIASGQIASWPARTDCSHFWDDMTQRIALLEQQESVPDRLGVVELWLHQARDRWQKIRAQNSALAPEPRHIDTMLAAAQEFRNENSI